MDDESQLNEYIKALRNALISITVLSVVAFITLEPKLQNAERYSAYDRLVVEYAILDKRPQPRPPVKLRYESGDGVIYPEDLGPNVPDFLFLARARYALPQLFYNTYCHNQGSVFHIIGNWKIEMDPEECTSVLPPSLEEMQELDMFTNDVGPFKEAIFLEYIGEEDVFDDLDFQLQFEAQTAVERFDFQADGPYELRLIAIRGDERRHLRIANTFGFFSNSCREGGGGPAYLFRDAEVSKQFSEKWCDLGGLTQSEIAFDLETVLAEYQGLAYRQATRTPQQYHQYGKAMAKDFNAGTETLPFLSAGIRSTWFLVASYTLIVFLLTWAIYLLSEIFWRLSRVPTIPSFYGIIIRLGALAHKDRTFSLAFVSALMTGSLRLACYMVPASVLILLIALENSSGLLKGINAFGVGFLAEIGITLTILSLGLTAATFEFKIIKRIWHSLHT